MRMRSQASATPRLGSPRGAFPPLGETAWVERRGEQLVYGQMVGGVTRDLSTTVDTSFGTASASLHAPNLRARGKSVQVSCSPPPRLSSEGCAQD
jgi:hypothetical protein